MLDMWSKRNLSFFGRILVVNTLVSSLFVYKLTVIPLLPDAYVKRYDEMVKRFIWEGKQPKIRYDIVQGLKCNSGAGLINLRQKDKALKAQWAVKIMQNQNLKNLAYTILSNKIGDDIWNIHLNPKDINCITITDSYWKDVLYTWYNITWEPIHGRKQVLDQIIWFNSEFKINNQIICYKTWIEQGIMKVRDIIKDDGKLIPIQEIHQRFTDSILFINLLGIYDAIPKKWLKILINSVHEQELETKQEKYSKYKSAVWVLYHEMVHDEDLV